MALLDAFRKVVQSLSEEEIASIEDDAVKQAALIIYENPDSDLTLTELANMVSERLGRTVGKATLYMKIKKWLGLDSTGKGEKEGEGSGRRGRPPKETVRAALESEYAALIKQVTEKTRWFNEALVEIGFRSTLAAFQYAKIPPDKFMEKVSEFQDPRAFVDFVLQYLDAMIRAGAEGAQRIVALEEENRKLESLLDMCTTLAEELRHRLEKAVMHWKAAISLMDEEQLRRYMLAYAFSELVGSGVGAPQGVEVSEGGS